MPQTSSELPGFFARRRALLEQAVAATTARDHWTPYPESPSTSFYGEDAAKLGEAAFEERLGGHFELAGRPGDGRVAAGETSPYGFELGISYPRVAPDEAVAAALTATGPWRDAGPDTRAGVAAEILGVHLSENLTGGVFVNQAAAFSDFHGSAANPAASATLSDPAFVTGRFATLQSRRPAPAEETPDA
ncbi:hypothetical protein ACN6K3_006699 [Streptomyces sp. SAS_260]